MRQTQEQAVSEMVKLGFRKWHECARLRALFNGWVDFIKARREAKKNRWRQTMRKRDQAREEEQKAKGTHSRGSRQVLPGIGPDAGRHPGEVVELSRQPCYEEKWLASACIYLAPARTAPKEWGRSVMPALASTLGDWPMSTPRRNFMTPARSPSGYPESPKKALKSIGYPMLPPCDGATPRAPQRPPPPETAAAIGGDSAVLQEERPPR